MSDVDLGLMPEAARRPQLRSLWRQMRPELKKLLVADMDSTMIGQECIDELAAFVGKQREISAITERSMQGELAFEPALRERCPNASHCTVGSGASSKPSGTTRSSASSASLG